MTDEDGKILDWNMGVARLLGYQENEFVGKNIDMLFTRADLAMGAPELERSRALEHGRSVDNRWHVRGDKRQVWVEGELLKLSGEAGDVRFAKVMHDATQMRTLQEESDRLRQEILRLTNQTG